MAGSVTVTHYELGNIRKIVCVCVGDAGDGTFPNTVLPRIEGRLLDLETDPGATKPTDNYDVTIEDAGGHDVLEGVGADRDDTNTEKKPIVYAATALHPTIDETDVLTLKIANNAVHSALTTISIYYALGG